MNGSTQHSSGPSRPLQSAMSGYGPFDSFAGGHEGSMLSLRSVAEACFRRRVRFLSVVFAVALATVGSIIFMPRRYEATMQLLVLNARQYAVITSDADEPNKQVGEVSDSDVNSQAELLRSHDVLNGALDQLNFSKTTGLARDKALEKIQHHLDVAPVRQSSILNVTLVDSSPGKARDTLQAIANSFVEKELKLLHPTAGQRVFTSLVQDAREQLTAAQQHFIDFKIKTGVASLSQDETGLVQQVRDAAVQDDALGSDLAAEQQRLQTAQEELTRHPERITTQNKSVPNGQAVQELSTKLVELKNKRTALLTGYMPTDRFVHEMDEEIATTEQTLKQMQTNSASEFTTDVNPLHQELAAQLARSSISSAGLAAKRGAVDAQRRTSVQKFKTLEAQSARFDALQRQVAEAQQNYDTAVHKRDQAFVEDALDRDRILNVAFAATPSASWVPVQPRPFLYAALGLFAALFLGVGSCAFAEVGRETVYSAGELDAVTGVLTLAVVPLEHVLTHNLTTAGNAFVRTGDARQEEAEFPPSTLEPYVARGAKG